MAKLGAMPTLEQGHVAGMGVQSIQPTQTEGRKMFFSLKEKINRRGIDASQKSTDVSLAG